MTKDDFISKLTHNGYVEVTDRAIDAIDELFNSNVVIPKGENRHQCADVIHAWAEGEKVQRITALGATKFIDAPFPLWDSNDMYRIKPTETIYEYLWYKENGETTWGTIKEFDSFGLDKWYQATETKRERK